MDNKNEIIAPSSAPLTHLQGDKQSNLKLDSRTVRVVGIAVGAVALVIVFALLWDPMIELDPQVQSAEATPSTTAPAQSGSLPPFETSQRALARERAQESLAAFVEKQIQLENEMQVDSWGADLLADALASAKQGDEDFVRELYPESLAAYDEALAKIEGVIEAGERLFSEHVEEARVAIRDLDHARASQALASARIIKPENPELTSLQARSDNIPQIQVLLRDAKNHELSARFDDAINVYEQVRALDPDTYGLDALIAEARSGQTGNSLQALISKGFTELSAGRFNSARNSFNAALKIDRNNEMATVGLQQVAEENDLALIRRHRARGEKALAEENWPEAQQAFGAILNLDANIQFAKDGVSAAQAHQRATTILNKIASEPQRLSGTSLYLEAQEIVAEAEQLPYRGAVLNGLIAEGHRLLALYKDPIDVVLLSDNQTDIIMSNIGRLGRFERKVVNLRPGAYTIRGSQRGCKDIYLSLEVIPGIDPINLSCPEKLASP